MERTIITLEQLRGDLVTVDRRGELYLCKSGPFTGGLGIDLLSEPAIDQAAMSVRMPISTQQLDRVNHVVSQAGMLLDEYADNPVVLYGHGCEGITLPVAMSESPDGKLAIITEGETTYATAFHSANQKLSTQIFGLVVDKFLRAASIGITPTVVSKGYTSGLDEVLFIDECILTEWSYVTVPCNPGAVLKFKFSEILKEFHSLQCESANRILERGTIDGSVIMPAIKKSLQSVLTVKPTTKGIDFKQPTETKEESKVKLKLSADEIKKMNRKAFQTALLKMNEYDDESQALMKASVELADDTVPVVPEPETKADDAEEVSEVPEVEANQTPLGAQVIQSIYAALSQAVDLGTKALGPVEAPDVKESVTALLAQAKEITTALEGIYSGKYEGSLAPAEDEPATEEMVKSFLAASIVGRLSLKAYQARLSMLATEAVKGKGKLPPAMVKMLSQTATDIAALAGKAEAFKPDTSKIRDEIKSEIEKSYKSALESVTKKFESVLKGISETPAPIER